MKKLFLFIACVLSITSLTAQNSQKHYVYGVDFSQVKVYAAQESIEQFAEAFEGINLLLASESSKYDFSAILGCKYSLVLDPIMKILSSTNFSKIKVYSKNLNEIDYAECIKRYKLPQKEGVGFVIIAKLLDKPNDSGRYTLIKFDIATREILLQQDAIGAARGFGLRNFWAGSVYNIIKSTKL